MKIKTNRWKKVFLFSLGALFGMKMAQRDYYKKVHDVVDMYREEIAEHNNTTGGQDSE